MATMNISLPDPMKRWIEIQAETGPYSNVSDYVRDLVRRDQERTTKIAAMQRLVDEAEASGITRNSMADIHREARRRAGVRDAL
ncbi:MAG: type II toxin-antitoxin system ParD family antitoxin [Sphingomonas sp.]